MAGGQRVVQVPAIEGFRASPLSYYGTGATGAPPASGPAGSSSMTFFCVSRPQRGTTTRALFNRSSFIAAGWGFIVSGTPGVFSARAYDGAAASVTVVSAALSTLEDFGVPYLLLADYQNGTLTFWLNGVLIGTAVGAAGFTPLATRPVTLGVSANSATSYAINDTCSDCGMLDGYDVSTYVDTMFGNGGVGLSLRWLADLREGRYLTWPRAAAVNSDWYWAARDVVAGIGCKPTWTDRYTAQAMTKFGQPQGSSFPARPA